MRNNSKKLPYYLDGFMEVYRPLENNVSTFGAKKNTRKKEEMKYPSRRLVEGNKSQQTTQKYKRS